MQSQTVDPTEKKYRGVRRRSWGKWVSEIRVPGTQERLWLGSYSNPEAAAVAHDTAVFFLRGPGPADRFNFPDRVGGFVWTGLSPRSVQKLAGDNGMAVDAELAIQRSAVEEETERKEESCGWEWREDILLEDMDFYM